jgi:hypothetical protein
LVLPLTAQPSARLEAEDTLPPSFIIARGLGLGLMAGPGTEFGLTAGNGAGPFVTGAAGFTLGFKAGIGVAVALGLFGTAAGNAVGFTPGANLII